MRHMEWHSFEQVTDDDLSCRDCGVTTSDTVASAVMIRCPAATCTDPANHDQPCVFAPDEHGDPECVYCGRAGDPHGDYVPDPTPLDDDDPSWDDGDEWETVTLEEWLEARR